MNNPHYTFVPAYGEWHFINTNRPDEVLLNWVDPVDSLYHEWDEDGNSYDEPQMMTSYDEVFNECDMFILTTINVFENGETDLPHNNKQEQFNKLPSNAAEIMAHALYDYYIAESITPI